MTAIFPHRRSLYVKKLHMDRSCMVIPIDPFHHQPLPTPHIQVYQHRQRITPTGRAHATEFKRNALIQCPSKTRNFTKRKFHSYCTYWLLLECVKPFHRPCWAPFVRLYHSNRQSIQITATYACITFQCHGLKTVRRLRANIGALSKQKFNVGPRRIDSFNDSDSHCDSMRPMKRARARAGNCTRTRHLVSPGHLSSHIRVSYFDNIPRKDFLNSRSPRAVQRPTCSRC